MKAEGGKGFCTDGRWQNAVGFFEGIPKSQRVGNEDGVVAWGEGGTKHDDMPPSVGRTCLICWTGLRPKPNPPKPATKPTKKCLWILLSP